MRKAGHEAEALAKKLKKDKAVSELRELARFYEERGLLPLATAVYKKIMRLDPENIEATQTLAGLFRRQGLVREAKTEYLKLARRYQEQQQNREAVSFYEKILRIDPKDNRLRLELVSLCLKENLVDKAVEALNEAAEICLRDNEVREASGLLLQARKLRERHPRTMANFIEVFKREKRIKEALGLAEDLLSLDKPNLKVLHLAGDLYLKEGNEKKAAGIFSRIISIHPLEAEARVKLGRIYLQKGLQDQAFEHFQPLIETLILQKKEKKAVGLLKLILSFGAAHLPTLEKLASIYRNIRQPERLLAVDKAILEEARRKGKKDRMLEVLKEVVSLAPDNEAYYQEVVRLKAELGILEEEIQDEYSPEKLDENLRMIQAHLARADLYAQQGLIRNARRILESLRLRFPGVPEISEKIAELKKLSPRLKPEEIPEQVAKVSQRESALSGTSDAREGKKNQIGRKPGAGKRDNEEKNKG